MSVLGTARGGGKQFMGTSKLTMSEKSNFLEPKEVL
jgi:hypothetical protein